MGGWRDTDGRTANERRTQRRATEQAQLLDDVRHRPITLLKGLAGFALILILAFALIGFLR